MDNKILLSILIPTYNRGDYLKKALNTIFLEREKNSKLEVLVEVLVSDNNSKDETQLILNEFNLNKNFKFWKNDENLGFDGNFRKLIEKSRGKYCWIFGDDEYLEKNSLEKILKILENKEIGHLYINNQKKKIQEVEYTSKNKYLTNISYMLTFITANIFNKELIEEKINYDDYIGTNLIQEMFYLQSILKAKKNIILSAKIFSTDRAENIGNYKLFETFGKNQNKIFDFFRDKGLEDRTIKKINKSMLIYFFPYWIINSRNKKNKWDTEDIEKELKIVFKNYKELKFICIPLIKLNRNLAISYYFMIRAITKMIGRKK